MNHRVRIHLIQGLILSASLISAALLLGPMKREADRRAALIRDNLILGIETDLDVRIRYQSISPALLSAVTIRGLSVDFEAGRFTADTIRVFYNPLRQIRGDRDDPLRMISRVFVADGSVLLSLSDSEEGEGSGRNASMKMPWHLLAGKTLVLSDIGVDVRTPNLERVEGHAQRVEIRHTGENVRYTFLGSGGIEDSFGTFPLGSVSVLLGSKGLFSPENEEFNARVDVESARSDLLVLQPLSLDVSYRTGVATVRRIDDERPLDLAGRYASGEWSLDGEAVNLPVSDIAVPGPLGQNVSPWMGTFLDGTFKLSGDIRERTLHYDIDLNANIPEGPVPIPIEVRADLFGDENLVSIDRFAVSGDWGRLDFQGDVIVQNLAPIGTLGVDVDESILGYPVNASFDLLYEQGTTTANPINVRAGDMDFQDFRFLVVREDASVVLSLLAVPMASRGESPQKIVLDAMIGFDDAPVIHGFASLDGVHSTSLARLASLDLIESAPVLKKSRVYMNGYFEANARSWVVNIEEASLISTENPSNILSVNGRAFPGRWALDSLHLSWNGYDVDGRMFAQSTDDGGIAEGRILIDDRVYPIDGAWQSDGSMVFSTDFGFLTTIGARSGGSRSIRLEADGLEVPLREGRLVSNLDVRGRIAANDWELFVNEADLSIEGRSDGRDVRLSVGGNLKPGLVSLQRIVLTDPFGTLTGGAVLEAPSGDRRISGRLFLDGDRDETYDIALLRQADDWDIRVLVKSGRLERFDSNRLAGMADIQGRLKGPIGSPEVNLTIDGREGLLDGQPFEAHASATMARGRLRVQDILFQHEGISVNRGLLIYDSRVGSIRATADIAAMFNQVPVSTGFSFAMDLDSPLSILSLGDVPKSPYKGTLATRPILWNTREHLPAFTFQFRNDDDEFRVMTPDAETLNVAYRYADGRLDVVSSDPMPIVARGGGHIGNGNIDLSFPELSIDPVLINYVMVRDPILLQYHVVFQGGRFIGNLDIQGPTGDPDLYGILHADNLKVDTPYTYADIQPASSDVTFQGNRIDFSRIEVPVGDGFVYGEGHIVIDRWALREFDMIYGGHGGRRSEGVPVYYPLLGVTLDGLFTGEIHMTGDGQRFYLNGDLSFPYLKVSLGTPVVPVPQRKEGKYPKPVYIDFDFITGNNCTFFLPNEQLKILRATAEPDQRINFTFATDPRSLSLTGILPIKSGNIYYFDRDFQVTEGSLRFNETLGRFDPMLDFRAETRVRDTSNEDVSVALVYNAPVKSDFNPRVETVPSRSELEILELFGQAVVPYSDSDGSEANTIVLATGGMFAQAGIVQPFEEVLRESLNLDMVTIRTDIIENTLAEGLGRDEGIDVTGQSSGLGRYLDNTSLFAGKYIGNALFVSGSVSANYFEEQRNRSMFGGLEFETSISFEMETPFFNVAWSYSPDPAVEQHFVADNEISLKWQFSF